MRSEYRVLRTGGERRGHAMKVRGGNIDDMYGLHIWVPMADHFFCISSILVPTNIYR